MLTVATMESLAAKVIISAQETTPGHAASSKLLILSIKSNPRTVLFGVANLSVWFPDVVAVEFSKIDASQP